MPLTTNQKETITQLLTDLKNDPFNEKLANEVLQILKDKAFAKKDLYPFLAAEINRLNSNFLHWLISWDKTAPLVKKLLDAGVKFDIAEGTGDHLLHVAVEHNRVSIVRMLLAEDMDYARDGDGELPPETQVRNKAGKLPINLCKLKTIRKMLTKHKYDFDAARKKNSRGPLETPLPNADGVTLPFSLDDEKDAICYGLPTAVTAPVGQLQWKDLTKLNLTQNVSSERWGSGSLVRSGGEIVFITAGHCFDPCKDKTKWYCLDTKTDQPIPSDTLATLMTVNLNYQASSCGKRDAADNEIKYEITSLAEHRYDGLDYAIVRLNPTPCFVGRNATAKKLSSHGTLTLSTTIPPVGSKLSIVQHPDGLPKKVQAGTLEKVDKDGKELHYRVSTDGGSSGSAVLDAKNQVVAIHNRGFDKHYKAEEVNSGVSTYAVSRVSPIVYAALFGNRADAKAAAEVKFPAAAAAAAASASSSSAAASYPTRFAKKDFYPVREAAMAAEVTATPHRVPTYQPAMFQPVMPQKPFHVALYESALADFKQDNTQAALNKFVQVYNNHNKAFTVEQNATILSYCGECYFNLGNYAKAAECFATSYHLNPTEQFKANHHQAQTAFQAQQQAAQANTSSCVIM